MMAIHVRRLSCWLRRVRVVVLLLVTSSTLAMAQSTGTSTPAAQIIIDRTAVQQAITRSAIVWDVRDTREYQRGHLPGAVSIGDAARVLRDDNREDFIPVPAIARILGDAGIDPSREIVVYGARGTWNAYFGLYTIQLERELAEARKAK